MDDKKGKLLLGTASVDITPEDPVFLAGFSHREGRSEGVANKLYAKIWFFKDSIEPDHHLLLIQADLIWFGNELVERYKKEITNVYKLSEASIIFHASHTHSGPQTSSRFSRLLGTYEEKYIENMMDKILSSIGEAISSLEEVEIYRGIGHCSIGVNRRKSINGIISMAPNDEGLIDDELSVIMFRNKAGAISGLMFHYSCHPTVTDSNYISSEYCGVAAEKIGQWLPDNAQVSFLQGFCGDIRPKMIQNESFYRGSQEDVERFADEIADQVKSVIEHKLHQVDFDTIIIRHKKVHLQLEDIPNDEELIRETLNDEDYILEWKRNLLASGKIEQEVPLDVSYVRISKALGFLFVSAEIVCEYGIYVKQMTNKSVLPLGYSNGMIGYIPTKCQLNEGGYEPKTSIYYFGLPSAFKHKIEEDLKNTFKEMMDEVG